MLINLTNFHSNSHLKKSSGNSECDFPLVCTSEEAQWSDHMPPCLTKVSDERKCKCSQLPESKALTTTYQGIISYNEPWQKYQTVLQHQQ